MLSSPLRDRFGAVYRLDFYTDADIESILRRSAEILGVQADAAGLSEIACRARGTPRVANRLLKRVRDYAQVRGRGVIDCEIAKTALGRLEVDAVGLDNIDHQLLKAIIEKFSGGPVGLETLAAAISEDTDTIMDIYEPYLMQLGFLERPPRGRVATRRASPIGSATLRTVARLLTAAVVKISHQKRHEALDSLRELVCYNMSSTAGRTLTGTSPGGTGKTN